MLVSAVPLVLATVVVHLVIRTSSELLPVLVVVNLAGVALNRALVDEAPR